MKFRKKLTRREAGRRAAAAALILLMILSCAGSACAADGSGVQQRSGTGISGIRALRVENGRLYAEGEAAGDNGVIAASLHNESNGLIASSPAADCRGKEFSLSFNLIGGELRDGSYYVVFGDIENTGISTRDLWSSGFKVSFKAKDNQVLDTWKTGELPDDGSSAGTDGRNPEDTGGRSDTGSGRGGQNGGSGEPGTGGGAAATGRPSDIDGHWAEMDIKNLIEKNILSGYGDGTFRPDGAITRAEFAQIAAAVFHIKSAGGSEKNGAVFHDVARGDWYWEPVTALAQYDIVSGVSETRFAPEEPVTREQMAYILYRAARMKQMDLAIKRDYTAFTDDSNISDYAKEAVKTMYQAELISGVGAAEGNRFLPQEGAVRAEVAALVNKLLNQMNN